MNDDADEETVAPMTEQEQEQEQEQEAPAAPENETGAREAESIDIKAGEYTPPNFSKEEIRQQAQAAMLGNLTKGKEGKRDQATRPELAPVEVRVCC